MAFDDIFEYIGGNGAFQIAMFFLLGLPCMYAGFQGVAVIFLVPDQDHWCKVEELVSIPYEQQKYVAIPYNADTEQYEHCEYYDMDYEQYTIEEFCSWNWSKHNKTYSTITCESWIYDRTQYAKTAVTEFNLVCDQAFLVGLVYSSALFAFLVAVFVSGVVSDYFGRKPVLVISCIFGFFFALLSSFAPNYTCFMLFRFTMALFSAAVQNCAFIMLTEYVSPKYREITGTLYWCFYGLGFMVLPVVAYFITDFKLLQIALAFIMLPSMLYFVIIPESPRWYVMNNKTEEAIEILGFIAEVNNKTLPDDARAIISTDTNEKNIHKHSDEENQGKWKILYTNSTMRKTILLNIPAYIACSMLYNGLSYNVDDLSGSIYMNTFISGLLEIPANFFALVLMHFIGRQKTLVLTIVLAGGFCLLSIPFTTSSGSTVVTSLAITGKTFIAISYSIVGLYTAELFPTNVRNTALGICTTCGGVAGMITPYMGEPLMAIWIPLPLLIFGLVGVLSGPTLLLLPETRNTKLPDTLEDAENLWVKSELNCTDSEMTQF